MRGEKHRPDTRTLEVLYSLREKVASQTFISVQAETTGVSVKRKMSASYYNYFMAASASDVFY